MPPVRRRQANIKGGRTVEHRVMVSETQETQLAVRADALGVTISKLLVDSALGTPVVNKRVILLELGGLRRTLNELRATFADDPTFVEMEDRTTAIGNAVFLP